MKDDLNILNYIYYMLKLELENDIIKTKDEISICLTNCKNISIKLNQIN